MKRILILASWYPEPQHPSKGIFVKRQAEALALHHQVYLAYTRTIQGSEKPGLVWQESGNLNECIALRPKGGLLSTLKGFHQSKKALLKKAGNFDRQLVEVVHPAGIYAWLQNLVGGQAYYISEHLDLFLREDLGMDQSRPFGRWLRQKIHAKAAGSSISSQALLQSFSKRGIPRLSVIPNVIDLPESIPSDWPESVSPKRFIHISSLRDHQKNIKGVLKGLEILNQIRQDWEFHFLGSGPDIDSLKEEASRLNLGDKVKFLGYVSEAQKAEALRTAIAHVMLSHYEGFSVSTAEAIAYGCPVVVSDCGGPGDFVRPENGYLIPKEPQILAETLSQHLDDFRSFNRAAMYHFIKARYSAPAVADTYADFLEL